MQIFVYYYMYCIILGDMPPNHPPFNESGGSNVDASCQTPGECFSVFFSDTIWQFLIDNTNQYAAQKISSMTVIFAQNFTVMTNLFTR